MLYVKPAKISETTQWCGEHACVSNTLEIKQKDYQISTVHDMTMI
jgi:hypothetical protein